MDTTFKKALLGTAAAGVMAVVGAQAAQAQINNSAHHQFSVFADFVYLRPDSNNNIFAVQSGSSGRPTQL